MFNPFKKTSKIDQLQKKYAKLMEEAYQISTVNRAKSDSKYAEADLILNAIKQLKGLDNPGQP